MRPDKFAVFFAFGEDADKAGLAVENAANVGVREARVSPSGGNGETQDVFGTVSGAIIVESAYSGGGAVRNFMDSGAV